MKKLITALVTAASLLVTGCAKEQSTADYDAAKRYLDSWIAVNGPALGAREVGNGIYICDKYEIPGKGKDVSDATYLFISYTIYDLEGHIQETTVEKMAQQLGTYRDFYYYGPEVIQISDNVQNVGITDMLQGMRIGGRRRAIIPRWLTTYKRYDSKEEYLKHTNKDAASNETVYEIEILDATDDIISWQIDSMQRYIALNYPGTDSTSFGFYYKQLTAPSDTNAFKSGETFYINYTGKLLNGQVFDTSIQDTAKFYNIYSTGGSYGKKTITWADELSEVKMGSSTIITGFAKTLSTMRHNEKGVGIFYSALGYGENGKTNRIPGFAPLIFEIETYDK